MTPRPFRQSHACRNVTIASSSNLILFWYYYAGYTYESRTFWDLMPNGTDRFLVEISEPDFRTGWMQTIIVARFKDPNG